MLSPSSVKQIPVESSLQLQLLSRIGQIWLPVDSKSTEPDIICRRGAILYVRTSKVTLGCRRTASSRVRARRYHRRWPVSDRWVLRSPRCASDGVWLGPVAPTKMRTPAAGHPHLELDSELCQLTVASSRAHAIRDLPEASTGQSALNVP